MLKKIVFTILLLIPNLGVGQIDEQILKQIEKIEKGAPGVPRETDPCSTCVASESVSAIFDACVKKVCTEKGLVPYTEIPAILPADLAKPAPDEKEVEAIFDKMIAIKSPIDTDVEREKIYDLLKAGKFAMTEDNLDLAFQYIVVGVGGQSIKWNMTTYRAEFDEEKFNEIALPLSEINKTAMKERVKAFVAGLPSAIELANSGEDNPDGYLASKYPGLSKVDAVKKLTAEFRNEYENFKQSGLGKLFSKIADGDFMFPKELVSEIESGKDVTDMSLRDLIAKKSSFSATRIYLSSAQASGKDKIDYKDLRTRMSAPAQIAEVIEKSKSDRATENTKKQDGKIACLSIYRRSLLTLPSVEQINALKKTINEVKKDIGEKWASNYSIHTQKKIAEYLEKVDFFLPPSRDDYSNGFKQRIQREIQVKARNAELNIKDRESLAFFMVLGSYSKSFSKTGSEKEKESSEYSEFCDKDKISPLNDANYTLRGKIQVSYTSAHALEMGKGVLAHELGHGISQIFNADLASDESSKKHQGFLSCLNSQHDINGTQYVEEDYADWVAANVTKANKACLYPQAYSPGTKQMENAFKTDTHSSEFFRLMHVESIQRGKLPGECNTFLVEQGTPKDFLSCQKLLSVKEAGNH